VAALHGYTDIFRIETLSPLVEAVERLSGRRYQDNPPPFRVIADHIRAATFAIADGVQPSNVEAGYVVRRLIRRVVRHARDLGIAGNCCAALSSEVIDRYSDVYPVLEEKRAWISAALDQEESKFKATLERALKQVEKVVERLRLAGETQISGREAFDLFETYGFPLPLTVELAREHGLTVDEAGFEAEYTRHRELSRQAYQGHFKGGLADHTGETTRLHTASHLLQAALRQVLGPSVHQMGSNITPERLRFDFSHPTRLSEAELGEVERIVNEQISRALPVTMEVMPLDQALQSGALAFFGDKYGEQVKVYSMGDFSKEVCGGPHVAHTGELGRFKLAKQEAVGQGIRRIRAVLEEGGAAS
jgi:alanyl-tRNA synthetase